MCDTGMSKKSANADLLTAAWEICFNGPGLEPGGQTRMHGGTLDKRVRFPGKCISECP